MHSSNSTHAHDASPDTAPAKKKRGKKKKKRGFWHFFKRLITVLIIIFLLCAIAGGVLAYTWISSAEPLDVEAIFNQNATTYIVDTDGNVIDKVHDTENRTYVKLDVIPKNLQNAFIAIEDKRFYKHHGFDPIRIFGAALEDLRTGSLAAGGSTITQQLVKNVYLTQDKLFKRKTIEIYYAMQLERKLTKDQILEAYLNSIDFSGIISGVKEAASYYFGKNVQDLNLAECATLAGITNNPSLYSPYANFDKSMERRNVILKEMLDQKMISKAEYDEAIHTTIVLSDRNSAQFETTYFADMVLNDVVKAFVDNLGYTKEQAKKKVYNGGLTIVSTMDPNIQNILEETFNNTKLFPGSVTDADGVIQPQAAMVVIDPYTGEIKGLMGGRSQKVRRGLNRATQSTRQPGSSIKPLAVYAPALENGYTPNTVIIDEPTTFAGGYKPKNSGGGYKGPVTLRRALQSSINIVACKIVDDIGPSRSYEYLEKFGITTLKESDKNLAAMALGGMTNGVKPLEMAAAYAVFPNNGIYNKPKSFTEVKDRNGKVIYKNNSKDDSHRVIEKKTALTMVDMMQGVVNAGTGGKARIPGWQVAGKTGTTDDKKDAWFVGYTPYYSAAVWIGYDTPKPMKFYGGDYPARVWAAAMKQIHAKLPKKTFERSWSGSGPEAEAIGTEICTVSGKLATDLCKQAGTVTTKYYDEDSKDKPTEYCDTHISVEVDTETNMLPTPYCPTTQIQPKVFEKGKEPKQTCTKHTGPPAEPPDIPGTGGDNGTHGNGNGGNTDDNKPPAPPPDTTEPMPPPEVTPQNGP